MLQYTVQLNIIRGGVGYMGYQNEEKNVSVVFPKICVASQ